MSETTRIERFKAHFGLTETPFDIGDDGQAFLDFVDAVLTSRTGPLNDLYNDRHQPLVGWMELVIFFIEDLHGTIRKTI